ncbi:MAG: patatin-like phospholipase family protein [Chloroflexi bacterium]|nr:patatin-like phospholipase family protein [Chloroflexota bacterium]
MSGRIALVLGGGGSRGLAHIGVLQVLIRERIPIDLVVGTSMGAIIGALHAAGLSPEEMVDKVQALQGSQLVSLNHLFSARSRQRTLEEWLEANLPVTSFEELRCPLTVVAVDVVEGEEITIDEGPLVSALLASSAVPGMFPPVRRGDQLLADGGVIDSLSTHIGYQLGAEKVIAVDVYPPLESENLWVDPLLAMTGLDLPFGLLGSVQENTPGIVASLWRSSRVMAWHLHTSRLATHAPDVLLRPAVEKLGSFDFKDIESPVQAGVEEAERALSALQALCSGR